MASGQPMGRRHGQWPTNGEKTWPVANQWGGDMASGQPMGRRHGQWPTNGEETWPVANQWGGDMTSGQTIMIYCNLPESDICMAGLFAGRARQFSPW